MNTLLALCLRRMVTGAIIFGTAIVLTQPVNAQRPSIADLQAQINNLQGPLDPEVAQVRTALDLLPVFQEAVARYFWETGEAPANRTEARLTAVGTDTNTNFISSVNIFNGTIVVTFGNFADLLITTKTLTFTPYETTDRTIVWRCGAEPAPINTVLLGTSNGGTTANYIAPTIPPSTYPDPCILVSQPGNQNDVIRAQVSEGVTLAAEAMESVATAFASSGEAPINRAAAGMTAAATDTSGHYVTGIAVTNGTITITYGNEANSVIQGQTLSLTPYESADLSIIWRCGINPAPVNASLLGTFGGGTAAVFVPPTILPSRLPAPCILASQPSSQDDMIRVQVLEAFDAVETIQNAIEVAGAALGSQTMPIPPADRTEAGLTAFATDTVGLYFFRVAVWNGTITVTYGNAANSLIAAETLNFTPYESVDGTIVWRCGVAPLPNGTVLMGTASGVLTATYIAPSSGMLSRYLPPHCR